MPKGKPRRAVQKHIPSGSTLSYDASQISSCWEDVIPPDGRLSPLPEEEGKTVVVVVLKKVE